MVVYVQKDKLHIKDVLLERIIKKKGIGKGEKCENIFILVQENAAERQG